MKVKSCVVIFSLFMVVQAVDWCNMKNCAKNKHIACNHNGRFSSSCNSATAVKLSSAQIQLVLDGHNKYRNMVASGKLKGFSSAKRMAKLTWNSELASLADMNTKQCKMKHDSCRNTPSFKYSGQNLAIMMTTGSYSTEAVIKDSLKRWFNEYSQANMEDINKVGSRGKSVGHFTAMVTDRSTQVGCAISFFKTDKWNNYLLACNYASTNMIGCPVYKSGEKASACKNGPDSVFTGLCRSKEKIDPNASC